MLALLPGPVALLTTAALAQSVGDFVVSPDIVLAANSDGSGYMVNGVGAPSVAWDPDLERYLMVYEVKLPIVDPECPFGVWGLGIAWSTTSATTGWVTAQNPLLVPVKGTFYGCVAAQPSIVYNPATHTLNVWFKGEQTDPPDPAIGPSRFTGVGRAKVKFKQTGQVSSIVVEPDPVLQIDGPFGQPRVMRQNGIYEIALQIYPDIWMASAASPTSFVLDAAPVISADPALNPYWAVDEVFNPALVCGDDPVYEYTMFVGGRDNGAAGTILAGGWSKAISTDTSSWSLAVDPYFTWANTSEWRHWDVLRVDDPAGTEYLVWYSEKDAAGAPQIRFASTAAAWDPADIMGRDCP